MTERLIRIALAFVVAFVFTGRMEAATAHCARLAQATIQAEEPMGCHDDMGMAHEAPAKPAHKHDPAGDRCECLGVLKACSSLMATLTSTRLEPYEWTRPETVAFASVEPLPERRPPRA